MFLEENTNILESIDESLPMYNKRQILSQHQYQNSLILALEEFEVDMAKFRRSVLYTGVVKSLQEDTNLILNEVEYDNGVKGFFQKLWNTVKAFFSRIFHFFAKIFMSRSNYVNKYKDRLSKGITTLTTSNDTLDAIPHKNITALNTMLTSLGQKAVEIVNRYASRVDPDFEEMLENELVGYQDKYNDLKDKENLDAKEISAIASEGLRYYSSKTYEKDRKIFISMQKALTNLETQSAKFKSTTATSSDKANATVAATKSLKDIHTAGGNKNAMKPGNHQQVLNNDSSLRKSVQVCFKLTNIGKNMLDDVTNSYWDALKLASSKAEPVNKFNTENQ